MTKRDENKLIIEQKPTKAVNCRVVDTHMESFQKKWNGDFNSACSIIMITYDAAKIILNTGKLHVTDHQQWTIMMMHTLLQIHYYVLHFT